MRAAILTHYDQSATGARALAAMARREGHDVMLLHFKEFRSAPVTPAQRRAFEEAGHLPVYETLAYGEFACPYPSAPTEAEKELLFDHLGRFGPDVIGISFTSSHLPGIFWMSRELRRRFPKAIQVFGGVHPTMDAERCLEHADAVCVGEGDLAFTEFLADPHRRDVANFWYRDNGGVVKNPMRPLVANLDELPFPFYGDDTNDLLIEHDRAIPFRSFAYPDLCDSLVISSQRGCPFGCTYCLHGVMRDQYHGQKYLRRKSVDRFLDEVELRAREFGLHALSFWDDILMVGREWIEEFAHKYKARIGLPFGGYGHANTTTRAMLDQLHDAGCTFMSMGVQSGSKYVSEEIYGRYTPAEKTVRFAHSAVDAGIGAIVVDLLTRCPFEHEQDLRDTANLLADMPKPVKIAVKQLQMYPFTPITKVDKPLGNVPASTYEFFEALFLLTVQPGFDHTTLRELAADDHLKAHPEVLRKWLRALMAQAQEGARAAELEARMPWGVKRAARHLAGEMGKAVRRRLDPDGTTG